MKFNSGFAYCSKGGTGMTPWLSGPGVFRRRLSPVVRQARKEIHKRFPASDSAQQVEPIIGERSTSRLPASASQC